jgi:hypothetical protein
MLFNYLINNDFVFYSILAGSVGFMGYSFATSYLNSFYVDKGVQTSAWEDYSNRPSQIASDSVTSLETMTPVSPTFVETSPVVQATSDNVSTVTTILPMPYPDIAIVSNQDIIELNSQKSLVDSKIQEINELFSEEMFDNVITDADLAYIVKSFTIEQLNSSNINEIIISIMEVYNG